MLVKFFLGASFLFLLPKLCFADNAVSPAVEAAMNVRKPILEAAARGVGNPVGLDMSESPLSLDTFYDILGRGDPAVLQNYVRNRVDLFPALEGLKSRLSRLEASMPIIENSDVDRFFSGLAHEYAQEFSQVAIVANQIQDFRARSESVPDELSRNLLQAESQMLDLLERAILQAHHVRLHNYRPGEESAVFTASLAVSALVLYGAQATAIGYYVIGSRDICGAAGCALLGTLIAGGVALLGGYGTGNAASRVVLSTGFYPKAFTKFVETLRRFGVESNPDQKKADFNELASELGYQKLEKMTGPEFCQRQLEAVIAKR